MTVSSLGIINYGTFNSFLAGQGGNQVDSASCSVQMTHKPVQTISAWTTDAQRGNSLHCTAENSLPLSNF